MLCKKCGAEITENAKFCGYCGEMVETVQSESQNLENNMNNELNETAINEFDLGKTIVVEPITPETENGVSEPVMQQNNAVKPIPSAPNNRKSKTPVFIIIGIILAVVAAILLVFVFTNNSSNSVEVLKKSISNIEKGYNSATISANLSVTATEATLDFSATSKIEKTTNNEVKVQLTVNPSLISQEMNAYAMIEEEQVNMYLQSTIIDMLEETESEQLSWVKYSLTLEEFLDELGLGNNENLNKFELTDVIDKKHFVYVEEVDELNHYELIIDQELIDKLKEYNEEESTEIMELEKAIKVDFYISKSNDISKIELDMSDVLTEEDFVSNLILSLELKDLNKTKVEIPNEALNAVTDLETYIENNSISSDYDYNYDNDWSY